MTKEMKQSTKVITRKLRLNYVNLAEPRAMSPGEEARYSLQALINKGDTETLDRINFAVEAAKRSGLSIWGNAVPGNLKTPLRDGDMEKPQQLEYKDCFFINCSAKQRPGVIDRDKEDILDETEVYSGCYGRLALSFYPYDKGGNKGIGCSLLNVQKLAEGEPLGRSTAQEDFADLEEEQDILG